MCLELSGRGNSLETALYHVDAPSVHVHIEICRWFHQLKAVIIPVLRSCETFTRIVRGGEGMSRHVNAVLRDANTAEKGVFHL